MTGLKLFEKTIPKYFLRIFSNPEEKKRAEDWLSANKYMVFMKDKLDLSICLGMYKNEPHGPLSEIGALEHSAKEKLDDASINILVNKTVEIISTYPFYQNASHIAAIPKSTNKTTCFTEILAEKTSNILGKKCLVSHMRWKNKVKSLQNLSLSEKRKALDESGLEIIPDQTLIGATVILIDDLYQSGTTLEFVAEKLKAMGVYKVYGLSVVKGLSNSDNTTSN
jgi:hypothetical protein